MRENDDPWCESAVDTSKIICQPVDLRLLAMFVFAEEQTEFILAGWGLRKALRSQCPLLAHWDREDQRRDLQLLVIDRYHQTLPSPVSESRCTKSEVSVSEMEGLGGDEEIVRVKP